MSRTGGEKTKASILAVAERLFAENGYSETSVDRIAKTAGVNKALIYYYFKNKEELALSLFRSVRQDLLAKFAGGPESVMPSPEQVQSEMDMVENKRDILALLLMESLRSGPASDFLFECGEVMAAQQLKRKSATGPRARNKILTREFYMGILPYMMFLILKDKWCKYFKCTPEQAKEDFAHMFIREHIEKPGHGKK